MLPPAIVAVHRRIVLVAALALAPVGAFAAAGLSFDGDADATLWLAARVPAAGGQCIYFEYLAPSWVTKDPVAILKAGGLELTDAGGTPIPPSRITIAVNQDFFDNTSKVLKAEYAGTFKGQLSLNVKLASGKATAINVGNADKPNCREGRVLFPGGVKLRAAADAKAADLGVAACDTRLDCFGGRVYATPPGAEITKTVIYLGVLKDGREEWVAASTLEGESFVEEGPPLAELVWGSDEYTGSRRP